MGVTLRCTWSELVSLTERNWKISAHPPTTWMSQMSTGKNGNWWTLMMKDSGDCREDLKAGDDNLAQEIQAKFDDGDDVFVTVLSAMGREKVIACKTGNK